MFKPAEARAGFDESRVNGPEYEFTMYKTFDNVVPAVDWYKSCGGDY